MTDEFDELIAGSLHSRAGEVAAEARGFHDVRRRVRHRRQRRVVVTMAPALAGFAFLGSRHPGSGTTHLADGGTTTVLGESPSAPDFSTTMMPMSTTTTLGVFEGGYRCLAASETGSDGEWVYYSACQPSFGGDTAPGVDTTVGETTSTTTYTTAPVAGGCQAGWYDIQVGDTPAAVAASVSVTVEELNAANASTPGYDSFFVGLRIVIPCASVMSQTSATTTTTVG